MNHRKIDLPSDKLTEFCRRHKIRRLALFGSVIRNDFPPESDVDVLVEFETGARVGLSFFRIEQELSNIIGRKVDLNTPWFLSKHFRSQILSEAEDQYVAAYKSNQITASCIARNFLPK